MVRSGRHRLQSEVANSGLQHRLRGPSCRLGRSQERREVRAALQGLRARHGFGRSRRVTPPTKFLGSPYLQDPDLTIYNGDVREVLCELPDESVQMCVTSPPYWGLRDYGTEGQIGLEPTPEAFVATMVEVFREVRRVLRKDGTLWLNLGDSYAQG